MTLQSLTTDLHALGLVTVASRVEHCLTDESWIAADRAYQAVRGAWDVAYTLGAAPATQLLLQEAGNHLQAVRAGRTKRAA